MSTQEPYRRRSAPHPPLFPGSLLLEAQRESARARGIDATCLDSCSETPPTAWFTLHDRYAASRAGMSRTTSVNLPELIS
jgi:hypothetical protein